MGRNTKKFIDKKKAATFQLMSRDSTDPEFSDAPGCDRVFVRVDNNPFSIDSFNPEGDADSIFADAPEECDGVEDAVQGARVAASSAPGGHGKLPDHVRKEIIELGFPDDGYNYLLHMREIRNTGAGSNFYENPKTRLDLVPKDVKAYDASRVPIAQASDDSNDASIYNVASRSVNVRVQKALDPEIAALLDDTDLSRFGSDVEDLEEDFVVQANVPDGEEEQDAMDRSLHSLRISEHSMDRNSVHQEELFGHGPANGNKNIIGESTYFPTDDKPRARRLLDEQFDTLAIQEYGSEDEDDYDNDYSDKEEEPLAKKLKNSINSNIIDEFDIDGDYKAPADLLHDNDQVQNKELQESAANLINRCMEYAEKYEEENDDREVVFEEESSEESEVWDCETIVSTYSNLENHPAKIGAPVAARKTRLAGTVPAVAALVAANSGQVISLKGKQKLPVEFLPQSRKDPVEKVKSAKPEPVKTRQHGQESKEEKKERKSAVKEERREARRLKKEMKGLYRGEAHRAQKVAAITGPSAIPLM